MNVAWYQVLDHILQLLIAYILTLPIAWNRERKARSAGLRTFPLVSVACCGFMLIGIYVLKSDSAQGRVIEGLITGMGFIGGGAILKGNGNVYGTATAASLWTTGAVGTAVAWNRYEIAIALAFMNYLTVSIVSSFKESLELEEENSDPEPG